MLYNIIIVVIFVIAIHYACAWVMHAADRCPYMLRSILRHPSRPDFLLFIAHPDDEAMFFAPLLHSLTENGARFHIICMSTGNYDGLGDVRKAEMRESAIGFDAASLRVIDDVNIQDGPRYWEKQHLHTYMSEIIGLYENPVIVTFDADGVSGHPNHLDRNNTSLPRDTQMLVLETVPLWRKYIGWLDLWISMKPNDTTDKMVVMDTKIVPVTSLPMLAHKSQLVWFRWLFVLFSRYMRINTLLRIPE